MSTRNTFIIASFNSFCVQMCTTISTFNITSFQDFSDYSNVIHYYSIMTRLMIAYVHYSLKIYKAKNPKTFQIQDLRTIPKQTKRKKYHPLYLLPKAFQITLTVTRNASLHFNVTHIWQKPIQKNIYTTIA